MSTLPKFRTSRLIAALLLTMTSSLGCRPCATGDGTGGTGGVGDDAAGLDASNGTAGAEAGAADGGTVQQDGGVTPGHDAGTAGTAHDGGSPQDAAVSDAGTDAGTDSGTPCVTLTVHNPRVWCNISVNGATASSALEQKVCLPPGTVQVVSTAINGTFQLGNWHGTQGDTGSGESGTLAGSNSTANVVLTSGTACVWMCCPFAGSGTGCAIPADIATDPCL
jgi:hypothetical protein